MSDNNRGRSSSPRARPWSAADSDKCEYVLEVMSDDVLLGRGSGPNDHVGNIKFRDLVHERKSEYLSTNHRQTKAMIAKDIVDQVYQRGGRFLKKLSPVESAKRLPELLAKNGMDDSENDRADAMDSSGPCDVYQIQKHATVMEKAKQALRQNQRNGSSSPPDHRSLSPNKESNARRDSMGRNNKISPDTPSHGILMHGNDQNNYNMGMAMGTMNIPTTLNNNSHNNQRQFHGNNLSDSFDQTFSPSSPHGRDSYQQQQQLYQQQQDLMNLQKQHEFLQMQYQQRQLQNQQHQFQSQQQELETHNQLLQEQLELQIRQEQLRKQHQQIMQKLANNAALFKHQQENANRAEHASGHSQSAPPAVLNGYATYTTTLDAIEDNHQNHTDGLKNGDVSSVGNETDPGKLHEKFDEKSMQLSTMMGSFKDMSVGSAADMHGSTDTIGTIDNIPSGVMGLSMVHMSGISIMSMMNDSTDSLFKNPHKAGNDVGAKNASWSNNSNSDAPNSSHEPLADVIESVNPAAVAAAAVLGTPVPAMDKAHRRWSGGFMPSTEQDQPIRRANRRGSLQYTSAPNPEVNQMNQMATATAMLAMAAEQGQDFSYSGHGNSQGSMSYGGNEMMNQNHGFTNDSAMAYGGGDGMNYNH